MRSKPKPGIVRTGSATAANSTKHSPVRSARHGQVLALAGILLVLFGLQAYRAAQEDSVTIDEAIHLPIGLYMLRTMDFSPDPINPPLARMLAALPLWASSVHVDTTPNQNSWRLSYQFMYDNKDDYQALFVRSRAVMIVLSSLLGILVFFWARQLYGSNAGLAALLMFTFSPEMLAHGHLVTLDMVGALGFTATAYSIWWLRQSPSLARAAVVGLILGISLLMKLSAVSMIAVAGITLMVAAWREREQGGVSTGHLYLLRCIALGGAVALLVINLGYGFQGTLASLDLANLHASGNLLRLRSALPWLRLPLPLAFINGIDEVMTAGVVRDPQYFLAGELSAQGWWYYHLAAFLLKTPLPLVVLFLWATVAWLRRRDEDPGGIYLFVPVVVLFVFNALFNSLNIGVRHVLPIYPLMFVASSRALSAPIAAWMSGARDRKQMLSCIVAAISLLWLVGGTVHIAPRYLQFFNELAGGADGGHRFLVDSNMDWGQDLIRLQRYLQGRNLSTINLAYFGRADPRVYGIQFRPLKQDDAHGPTVVSASFLMGRPYFWFLDDGNIGWVKSGTYTWLQAHEPVARVGALFVYDLP